MIYVSREVSYRYVFSSAFVRGETYAGAVKIMVVYESEVSYIKIRVFEFLNPCSHHLIVQGDTEMDVQTAI